MSSYTVFGPSQQGPTQQGPKRKRMKGERQTPTGNGNSDGENVSRPSSSSDEKFKQGSKVKSTQCNSDHGVSYLLNLRATYPLYSEAPRRRAHTECSERCRMMEETEATVQMYHKTVHSPLMVPLLLGYAREVKRIGKGRAKRDCIFYVTPCGVLVKDLAALDSYLIRVRSSIPITYFSFETTVNVARHFLIRRTQMKGKKPSVINVGPPFEIPAFDCFGGTTPTPFVYINRMMKSAAVGQRLEADAIKKRSEWCGCADGVCGSSGEGDCLCMRIHEGGGSFEYGLLSEPQSYLVECCEACSCSSVCRYRVSTNQIPWKVLLYYYPKKGWGVRSTCDIPKGAFVGLYLGQLLSETEVERNDRPDTYFFTLQDLDAGAPLNATANGDQSLGLDTTVADDRLLSLDANKFGNFTRFFNHSCEPNCFAQVMYRDYVHPLVYSMGFFTRKNIKAGEEMTWDYNYKIDSVLGRKIDCHCGAAKCRKRLL